MDKSFGNAICVAVNVNCITKCEMMQIFNYCLKWKKKKIWKLSPCRTHCLLSTIPVIFFSHSPHSLLTLNYKSIFRLKFKDPYGSTYFWEIILLFRPLRFKSGFIFRGPFLKGTYKFMYFIRREYLRLLDNIVFCNFYIFLKISEFLTPISYFCYAMGTYFSNNFLVFWQELWDKILFNFGSYFIYWSIGWIFFYSNHRTDENIFLNFNFKFFECIPQWRLFLLRISIVWLVFLST